MQWQSSFCLQGYSIRKLLIKEVLDIDDVLQPGRIIYDALMVLADYLENDRDAPPTAAFT